jgi:hypothetical protein
VSLPYGFKLTYSDIPTSVDDLDEPSEATQTNKKSKKSTSKPEMRAKERKSQQLSNEPEIPFEELLAHLLIAERPCTGLDTPHTRSGAATPGFVEPVIKEAHVLKPLHDSNRATEFEPSYANTPQHSSLLPDEEIQTRPVSGKTYGLLTPRTRSGAASPYSVEPVSEGVHILEPLHDSDRATELESSHANALQQSPLFSDEEDRTPPDISEARGLLTPRTRFGAAFPYSVEPGSEAHILEPTLDLKSSNPDLGLSLDHLQNQQSPLQSIHHQNVATKECNIWELWTNTAFPGASTNPHPLSTYLGLVISSLRTLAPRTFIDMYLLDVEYWTTFYEHKNSPVLLLPPTWVPQSCGDDQIAALRKALGPNISDKNHFGAIVFGDRHFWFVYGNKTDIYVLGREISDRDNTKAQRYEWKFYQNHRKEDAKLAFNVWSLAKRLLLWTDADRPNTVYLKSWEQNGFDCGLHAIYMAKLCMVAGLDPYNLTINRQSELLCTMHGRSRLMDQASATIQSLLFHLIQIGSKSVDISTGIEPRNDDDLSSLHSMLGSDEYKYPFGVMWDLIRVSIIGGLRASFERHGLACTCNHRNEPLQENVVSFDFFVESISIPLLSLFASYVTVTRCTRKTTQAPKSVLKAYLTTGKLILNHPQN